MHVSALRLQPGSDLRSGLLTYCRRQGIQAAWVLTCVGSLQMAVLRFAGQATPATLEGPFEILGLSGTISQHGLHLHILLAGASGSVLGGHLCEGSAVYTTAEIVLGVAEDLVFRRLMDSRTRYSELVIESARAPRNSP
ncbi:MAG TPA: PPC domain-containing DNA-binding protein [Verrucomicrobiales bacterium]|nr:PPC domain-containing DNA-binding protein [Verrucomicrobiales bacterium]